MGKLINLKNNEEIYLNIDHIFGRDQLRVDTYLNNALCSRIHCTMSYHGGRWFLQDKSSNGTFINSQRLENIQPLQPGDKLSFPGEQDDIWQFVDNTPPLPVLVSATSGTHLILEDINLLPNQDSPECVLSRQNDTWVLEQNETACELKGKESVYFQNEWWVFYPNNPIENTVPLIKETSTPNVPKLSFNVSLTEENVQLVIELPERSFDLGYKVQHQLLLMLARRRIEDYEREISVKEQGWLSSDVLSHELAIQMTHLNTLIYRCRKAFHEIDFPTPPIERRQGELRLCSCEIKVQKGDTAQLYQL